MANPAPSASVYVVRAPAGLAQGRFDVPPWVIALSGGLLIAGGVVYFAVRLWRALR